MKIAKFFLLGICVFTAAVTATAQNVSIKSNLLYDAAANINLGAEVRVAPRWSIELTGDLNAWTIDGHRWRHWFLQPEARYWFCDAFAKHFVGVHAIGGQYNVGNMDMNFSFLGTDFRRFKDARYQGWGIGGGINYGYALALSRSWNLEFEIGLGYVYLKYDRFECVDCGRKTGSGHHNYYGPTEAAVNLVYIF